MFHPIFFFSFFRTTTPDVNTLAITDEDKQVIPEFVSAAHDNGVSASISVGGWTGSRFFSTAVATAENRTAFVNTLSDFVKQHGFDGIDFEYVHTCIWILVPSDFYAAGSIQTIKGSDVIPSQLRTLQTSSSFSRNSAPRLPPPNSSSAQPHLSHPSWMLQGRHHPTLLPLPKNSTLSK